MAQSVPPSTREGNAQLFILNESESGGTIGKKIFCETFLHTNSGIKRLIMFLDSGADLSICQESYLNKILSREEIDLHKKSDNSLELTSYSNTKIILKFKIRLHISFSPFDKVLPIMLYIINDIETAPPLLLGADVMKSCLMNVAYVGSVEDPIPQIRVVKPSNAIVKTYYNTERQQFFM